MVAWATVALQQFGGLWLSSLRCMAATSRAHEQLSLTSVPFRYLYARDVILLFTAGRIGMRS